MTVRYVGIGGNNSNDGLSWANRKLTLNGVEDTPVVAGDFVWVGAGTYRELLTVDVSGGNTYSTGTISVTNGSAVVTGSGTSFLANVAANYIFHCTVLARGTDGVTTAVTATSHAFTSAAGNFQAGHVGRTIRVNTIGAYIIIARVSATEVTIAKPDNSSFLMVAGTGLTYDVGPESPYEILSVDSDTQITLTKPWGAESFTGLAYLTYNPIRYIGDYLGTNTDGVGGVVRVTGSDNDQTATRVSCINAAAARNYRIWDGFTFDMATAGQINNVSGAYWIIQKCFFNPSLQAITTSGSTQAVLTVQNCCFITGAAHISIAPAHSAVLDNVAYLIQSCLFLYGSTAIQSTRIGGFTIRNNLFMGLRTNGIQIGTALTVGQTLTVNNCLFQSVGTAVNATVAGEITENYNQFFGNNANRTNVLTGANSNVYPLLLDTRWFFQLINAGAGPNDVEQLVSLFDLASYSPLLNVAGTSPTTTDLRGTAVQGAEREWGALEHDSTLKIAGSAAGGSGISRARVQGQENNMQGYLKQSTAVNITVLMVDSTDHVTGKTGLSAGLTIYATKGAGTPAVITPTVTELDSTNVKGIYKLAFTTSHTDTLGELQLHITATGADPTDVKWQVSANLMDDLNTKLDTIDDFLDTEIAAIKAKTDNLPTDPADDSDIDAQLATIAGYLDTEVAAIKAKTDNLPSDPADASDITSSFSTVNSTLSTIAGYIDTEVAAILAAVITEIADIKAKTDNLPIDPADASDITTSFTTVNTKLDTIDDFLDLEVAAIKAKTDNLPAFPANEATLTTIAGYIDTEVAAILAAVVTEISDIKVVTDLLNSAQVEPTGAPSVNPTPLEKLARLYQALRNKITVTGSSKTFYDNSAVALWSKTLSDDGTTYSEQEGS